MLMSATQIMLKEHEREKNYLKRLEKIMQKYDANNFCHFDKWHLSFITKDERYVIICALMDILKAIKNGKTPTFHNLEHYEYEYDAYDEIDFDDYEDFMECNFTCREIKVRVRSTDKILEDLAEIIDEDLTYVEKEVASFEGKHMLYRLIQIIEYTLQIKGVAL